MQSMAVDDGVALCCHVLDALGVDGTGEDDRGCCALSSVPSPGLSGYISSECDVTYAELGNSNVSLNEIGFATATTSTNNHIEQQTCVAASDIVMKRGRQRYETNELADRCGDMQTE